MERACSTLCSLLKLRFMPEEKPNVVWGELLNDLVKCKFNIKEA